MQPPDDSLEEPRDDQTGDLTPYIILDLPLLCDEAALQVAELLKEFAEQFAEYYEVQIHRAMHRRSREDQRRFRRLKFLAAQKDLFDDHIDDSSNLDDNSNNEELPFNDDF